MKTKLFLLVSLIFLLAVSAPAWGTLLLEENFNYTAGSVMTDNGWTQLLTTTTNPITVVSPGLSALGHPGSGTGNAIQTTTGQDINKALSSTITTGSIYFAAMVKVDDVNISIASDYFFALQPSLGSTTYYARLFITPSTSGYKIGISKYTDGLGASNITSTEYSVGSVYTVVVKYTYIDGVMNDEIKVFVLESTSSIPLTEPTPAFTYVETTKADASAFGSFLIRQGGTTSAPTNILDGIRVGISWAELFPPLTDPTIVISPSVFSGFSYDVGNGPSSAETFTISGINLTGNITLTESANYEISTNGVTYSSPIILTQSGGSVGNTTIYVRLKSGLPIGLYDSETITATSSGAVTKYVTCSGYVLPTEPAAHVTNFNAGTLTSTSINLTWTDASANGYLIKGSVVGYGDIVDPVDVIPVTNTTLVSNIAQGLQTFTFTGLDINTTYYFKIYPYSLSGAIINYKTNGTVPEISASTNTSLLLLEENFDYVSDTYLHDNNWNVHSGAGTIPPKVGLAGLTYPGYPSVSGLDGVTQGSGEDINRTFIAQTSGTIFSSFLMNLTESFSTADYVFHFGTNPWTTGFYGKVYVQKDAATTNYRIGVTRNSSGAVAYTDYNYIPGTTYLIVISYTYVDGTTNDEVNLWVNPSFPGTMPAANLTVNTADTTTDASNIGGFGIRQGSNTPLVEIDGIRIGTNWDYLFPSSYTGVINVVESITPFTAIVGTPSTEQSYQLSGTDLISDFIDVSVTGPFQIAELNAMVWGTELTNLYSFETYDILVRYNPTEAGTHTGTITHSVIDGEAAPVVINLSGTATSPLPSLSVLPAVMTFSANNGETSATQSATITSANLSLPIDISSDGAYTFSATEGGSYTGTLQLAINYNGTFWIKFTPPSIGTFNNTISLISGTTTSEIAVAGYGLDPDETYAPDLFFSEYIEGSSFNKAIEIFNGTGHPVDLSDYQFENWYNGLLTPSLVSLTTTLAHGDVYVIANPSASASILALADQTSGNVSHNGDDALALRKLSTDTLVDIFGRIGEDPGTAWGTAPLTTINQTLVRKSTVYQGVTVNPTSGFPTLETEWDAYAIDTFDYLGSHTFTPGLVQAEAPTFDPVSGIYTSTQNVTISSATVGATIRYTTDGSIPTDTYGTIYSGPVAVSTTTTLKAVAYGAGFAISSVAEAIYTFPTDVSTIAALRAGTEGVNYRLTGVGILTFQQAFRNQKFIQDATGGILIDDNSGNITTIYNLYDGLINIVGTVAEYGGMKQFTPIADPGAPFSTGNTVTPPVITLSELVTNFENYESELVKVTGITFDTADGIITFANGTLYPMNTAAMDFRTTFYDVDYIGTVVPTGTMNIIGIPNSRVTEGNLFNARFLADFETAGALDTPVAVIYLESGSVKLSWVTIPGASSYKIYGSNNPYATFPGAWTLLDSVAGLNYTYTGTEIYKFFKVTANN